MKRFCVANGLVALLCLSGLATTLNANSDVAWLSWSEGHARNVAEAYYVQGRAGGLWDGRGLKTERAVNYKLAATWMTAEAIHGSARVVQIGQRLSDAEAQRLAAEATGVGGFVVMVEIDPNEGSGVIPREWAAYFQPVLQGGARGRPVKGVSQPGLREVKALSGVLRRNYDYDRFWIVFPFRHVDGEPVLPADTVSAELVVRIHDQEGRVQWAVPPSVRAVP